MNDPERGEGGSTDYLYDDWSDNDEGEEMNDETKVAIERLRRYAAGQNMGYDGMYGDIRDICNAAEIAINALDAIEKQPDTPPLEETEKKLREAMSKLDLLARLSQQIREQWQRGMPNFKTDCVEFSFAVAGKIDALFAAMKEKK